MLRVISQQKQGPSEAHVSDGRAVDTFGRTIDYLRISVTDRCNFRCVYCMPADGYDWIPRTEVLTFEEITRLARVFVGIGVQGIRLTGGEPTVRKNIVELVGSLSKIEGLHDLSMTTNGLRLASLAAPLVSAGMTRFNVSLDSLRTDRFSELTRGGDLDEVLRGIQAVLDLNLANPVKINVVVVGGVNDDEVVEIVEHFNGQRVVVRFIEYMPFTDVEKWKKERFVPLSDVLKTLQERLELVPSERALTGNGPAKYWDLVGSETRVGFIHPVSDHFCAACNRVRLTADGELRPCLGHEGATQLRNMLRAGASDEQLRAAIAGALNTKPERHTFAEDPDQAKGVMTSIGG